MLYCPRCKSIITESAHVRCPFCGAKKIREVKDNDPIYLTCKNYVFSGLLEDVLKQHQIPCIKKPVHGAALSLWRGNMFEKFTFFVPFGALEKSKELLKELFTKPDEELSVTEEN